MRQSKARGSRKRRTPKRDAKSARSGRPPEWGTRSPTYESRMKAAGFSKGDDPPADVDAFRGALARRIAMFVNNWRGCPERLCRRMRGCMAPRIRCTNAPPRKADPEALARTLALVHRTVREIAAQRAAEQGE